MVCRKKTNWTNGLKFSLMSPLQLNLRVCLSIKQTKQQTFISSDFFPVFVCLELNRITPTRTNIINFNFTSAGSGFVITMYYSYMTYAFMSKMVHESQTFMVLIFLLLPIKKKKEVAHGLPEGSD